MKKYLKMRVFWFFLGCLPLIAVQASADKVIYCYFGSWSCYRPKNGKFIVEDIDPSLCTHLVYTFVGLEGDNVSILDPWQDLPDSSGKDGFRRFNELRLKSPGLKTMIAMGGWNEGSTQYSEMASTLESRRKFINNVVRFITKYGFNGFDLDWEYPAQRGGVPEDRENYVALLKELRLRFDEEGLILSAAVAAAESSASKSFIIPEISKYLDFINIMAYDFHGAKDPVTGINAPLRVSRDDAPKDRKWNVEAAVKYWLQQGAPKEKLILGMPLYGRTFTLINSANNSVGAPARGPGAAGPYTREPGVLAYNEICESQARGGWKIVFDDERYVPYMSKGNQWVGYDNVKSIAGKAKLIKDLDLAGAMVWSVDFDDFRGICGEKYPLLKTVNAVLQGRTPVPDEKTTTQTPGQPESTPPSSRCEKEGLFPDPHSCGFISCIKNHSGEFIEHAMQCPPGLCFNPKNKICDWSPNEWILSD
ncbi:chitinase-3-like protein 1 [Fopius arisanus]|uniref:chitinase n=1 Tax=Fopius arisanus TaxID=64838 RepID=A0A9R1TIT3_9HYME|nr:PREDICTED: chitinase-3-like protein 1 [Fopius arisanus]